MPASRSSCQGALHHRAARGSRADSEPRASRRWACREVYRADQETEIGARTGQPRARRRQPRHGSTARGCGSEEKQGVRGCTRVACDLTCGRVNALLDRVRICLGAWSSRSTNPGHCRNQRFHHVPAPALTLGWSVHQPGEGTGRSSRLLYWEAAPGSPASHLRGTRIRAQLQPAVSIHPHTSLIKSFRVPAHCMVLATGGRGAGIGRRVAGGRYPTATVETWMARCLCIAAGRQAQVGTRGQTHSRTTGSEVDGDAPSARGDRATGSVNPCRRCRP
jgi:hypothetical protein